MTTTLDIETSLGRLHVRIDGEGPGAAVLWHSLFVDSTTWEVARPVLARHRQLIVIDGPAHGASGPARGPFTLDNCADAAAQVLDHLAVADPVDWVGNAWGGHVGLVFAARAAARCRTLVTIGAPVHPLGTAQRLLRVTPLVALYRLGGPTAVIRRALRDTLLDDDAVAAEPDLAQRVMDAFVHADPTAMLEAMRSAMLHRPDLTDRLPTITVPTMVVAADRDRDWSPGHARHAAARMPAATHRAVPGGGHIAPLLLRPGRLLDAIATFWADPELAVGSTPAAADSP